MVIDAFRVDFIQGESGRKNMPYTASLITENKACKYVGRVSPPTVTMPRIKALTAGTVPNFIDVILNFGSSEVAEDNLLYQALNSDLKIVFYGDDTWLKLFPGKFMRSEGTSSFFVSDFWEVDFNVTRNLSFELDSYDWNIMILHYLGLDHIGHVEGPNSHHIGPKLNEMDGIIKFIHKKLSDEKSTGTDQSLLVVCGDHGMKDSGGHGGASLPEIMVPIVVFGQDCQHKPHSFSFYNEDTISQIDLVPTLAILLGMPIPAGNLGKAIYGLLHHHPPSKILFYLHYNAKQVAERFRETFGINEIGCHSKYELAQEHFEKWLKQEEENKAAAVEVIGIYYSALSCMSSKLSESMIKYDMHTIFVAIGILFQVTVILCIYPWGAPINIKILQIMMLIIMLFVINLTFCINKHDSFFCASSKISYSARFFAALIISFNLLALKTSFKETIVKKIKCEQWFLISGTAFHTISMASSSFIEEEHQVWYFLWVTLALINLYNCTGSFKIIFQRGMQSQLHQHHLHKLCGKWIITLLMHCILRKLNQTGDKWAHLPDIGDWLGHEENKIFLSLLLLLGLIGLVICCQYVNKGRSVMDITLYIAASGCIYLYRAAIGNVLLPFNYPQSRGLFEAYGTWCTLSVIVIKSLIDIFFKPDYKSSYSGDWTSYANVLHKCFAVIIVCWMILCSLLYRPHNVILISSHVFVNQLVFDTLYAFGNTNDISLPIQNYWLGMVFYFYQGNSNSLATIDIAAGYIGQENYNFFSVGALLLIHTYCAPVLSTLLLMKNFAKRAVQHRKHWFDDQLYGLTWFLASSRSLLITIYSLLVTFQRYHLFVWTVFAPKLLYEASLMVCILVKLIFISFVSNTVLYTFRR